MTRSVSRISEKFPIATANDVDRSENTVLDISGADCVLLIQPNDGTAGTLGIDVIEVSVDGSEWVLATTAALAGIGITGHPGLLLEDGSKAAAAGAALNAAGVEPTGMALFSLDRIPGPASLRVGSATLSSGTAADWSTGAPSVQAIVVGGNPTNA